MDNRPLVSWICKIKISGWILYDLVCSVMYLLGFPNMVVEFPSLGKLGLPLQQTTIFILPLLQNDTLDHRRSHFVTNNIIPLQPQAIESSVKLNWVMFQWSGATNKTSYSTFNISWCCRSLWSCTASHTWRHPSYHVFSSFHYCLSNFIL